MIVTDGGGCDESHGRFQNSFINISRQVTTFFDISCGKNFRINLVSCTFIFLGFFSFPFLVLFPGLFLKLVNRLETRLTTCWRFLLGAPLIDVFGRLMAGVTPLVDGRSEMLLMALSTRRTMAHGIPSMAHEMIQVMASPKC